MHTLENIKEGGNLEDLSIDGRIIRKCIDEKNKLWRREQNELAQDRIQWDISV
jgi:hypothetical protein